MESFNDAPNSETLHTMKKAIILCPLWLCILGIYIFYGYCVVGTSDDYRTEASYMGPQFLLKMRTQWAVLWGGYGIGLATCVTVGLLLVSLARAGRLQKGWALLLLLVSAACSTILTPFSISFARDSVPVEILDGESGLLPFFQAVLMFYTAALSFVVFSVWIFLPKRKKQIAV